MEVVDNTVMLIVPGAMDAPVTAGLFWISLAGSLLVAGLAAYPLNRWLIKHGHGHAMVHSRHPQHAPADPASGEIGGPREGHGRHSHQSPEP